MQERVIMSNYYITSNELYHHGILGMHWGVRRYQNKDGSLTEEGKKRYYNADGSLTREGNKAYNNDIKTLAKNFNDTNKYLERRDSSEYIEDYSPQQRRFTRANDALYKQNLKRGDQLYNEFSNKWGKEKMKDYYKSDTYLKYSRKGKKYYDSWKKFRDTTKFTSKYGYNY